MTHSVLCAKMPGDRIDNNRRAMTATTDVRPTEAGKHKRPNHKFEERCSPRAEIYTERNQETHCTSPAFPVRFGSVSSGSNPPARLAPPAAELTQNAHMANTTCDAVGVSADATRSRLVKRTKTTLRKQEGPTRVRRFIGEQLTAQLFQATVNKDKAVAMLYLLAYAFMLRVPSEALPVLTGDVGEQYLPVPAGVHSRIGLRRAELVLQQARRKNRPHG